MGNVGVDVGGSGVRAALVYPDGGLGPICRCGLPDRTFESVMNTIVEAIGLATSQQSPVHVGVGVPGFVHQGTVIGSPNFPKWKDVSLSRALSQRLGINVTVENDANAATVGAWHFRQRPQHMILLTLGTGVGGGVITDGHLLLGSGGTGGELGHLFAGGESLCGCGGRGCLETWCSTVGMVSRARNIGLSVSNGEELMGLARGGDSNALAILEDAGRALGRGLVTLTNIFNPQQIVIAGGLTAGRLWLDPPARAGLLGGGIGANVASVEIFWEGRADEFAIVGAALLALPDWSAARTIGG